MTGHRERTLVGMARSLEDDPCALISEIGAIKRVTYLVGACRRQVRVVRAGANLHTR